ncbi:MAG: HTH-type transcriptional activator IlvY [Deltaproteobacteria bacterium]|nr:HTH-type transcriptional activator IlvY [Deltaproteobacteria bacterium]
MNIQELKIFKHLASSLHFGRTSQACNITPSALTRTIQRLEEEAGKKLFIRDNRSVSLTRAGIRFRAYAEEMIKNWRKLQNDLSIDEEILRGEISLYCSVTAVYSILLPMLKRYRKLYPEVHINLQTGDAANALQKLLNGEADVAIAALPEKFPAGLEFITMIETPLVFIAPAHADKEFMSDGPSIDWRTTPMIMAERGLGRQRLDSWFKDHDIQPNIYAQVAGNEAIIAMVSLGCGIGVVPRLVLDLSPMRNQVSTMAVSPELAPFRVGVGTFQKNMANSTVQAFWRIASQQATEAKDAVAKQK